MDKLQKILANQDWQLHADALDSKGYTLLSGVLSASECRAVSHLYNTHTNYRKTVDMGRYRYGVGEYKYFAYPLPETIDALRHALYPYLAPIANQWMQRLKVDTEYPLVLEPFLKQCHEQGQPLATPLVLKYEQGGFNTLHQDLYGDVYFPFQAAVFLSDEKKDFEGGEFVLTEQIPRAQSQARVIRPKQGDLLVFATQFRPAQGARGFYRAKVRHGVSEITQGTRYTLGIIFHDAAS